MGTLDFFNLKEIKKTGFRYSIFFEKNKTGFQKKTSTLFVKPSLYKRELNMNNFAVIK